MVKGNKQTTNTATEMKEMRTLIQKLFAELNTRQDKFDQTISELKESIQFSKAQQKAGNSSAFQGPGKTLTATGPNEKQAKGNCLFCDEKSTCAGKCSNKKNVSLIEDDDDIDVPAGRSSDYRERRNIHDDINRCYS